MAYILFDVASKAQKGRTLKVHHEDGSISSVLVLRRLTVAGVPCAIVDRGVTQTPFRAHPSMLRERTKHPVAN